MEAENQDLELNLLDSYCFKILYPDQNYKKSIEYQKWKKSITEVIGQNTIEMFCFLDKLIIIKKKEDINQELKCPICKGNFYICQNCKKVEKDKICCTKTLIKKYLANEELYKFMNLKNKEDKNEFIIYFIVMLIPYISTVFIFFYLLYIFYAGLSRNGIRIADAIWDGRISFISYIIMCGFIFLISLVYAITQLIFYVIILIFSIPFNLYPIRFLFGLLETSD